MGFGTGKLQSSLRYACAELVESTPVKRVRFHLSFAKFTPFSFLALNSLRFRPF